MKFNWKILIPIVIIGLIVVWSVDSLRSRSYSGTDVEFAVGGGVVTLNNSSDDAVPVQLIGSGVRSFSIVNSTLEITSSSVREGNGSRATQTLAFDLPSGITEFTIARGRDVNFVATNAESIDASVQPLTQQDIQATLIFSGLVILLCLYFISRLTNHALLKQLRNRRNASMDTQPVEPIADSQGTDLKSFGDNRTR